jgi:hypothetical protein
LEICTPDSCNIQEIPRWRFGMTGRFLVIVGKEAASRKSTYLPFILYPAAARRFFPSYRPQSLVIPSYDKP